MAGAPALRAQDGQIPQPAPHPVIVKDGYLVVPLPEEGVTVVARPADSAEGTHTGWASWSQRGELIWRGEMTDAQGRRYNVRILPGYPMPWSDAGEAWTQAGRNLHEYLEAQTWKDLGRHMKTSFRWGWKDAFWEFGLDGTGKAWKRHFADAGKRVKRRTFGWPLAYPWAFLAATFESAVRVIGGVGGAAGGTLTAAALLPAAETAWPLIKASYHAGVEGVVFPVLSWTWQTVAAPPAALFASAPSPARADGLWMRLEAPKESKGPAEPPSEPVLQALEGYARELAELDRDSQPALKGIGDRQRAEVEAVRARYAAEARQVMEAREARLKAWLELPGNREAVRRLAEFAGTEAELRRAADLIVARLVAGGLSEPEARGVVNRLCRHPLSGTKPAPLPVKVDPGRSLLKAADEAAGTGVIPPPKAP